MMIISKRKIDVYITERGIKWYGKESVKERGQMEEESL